jgi:hypothetical protein
MTGIGWLIVLALIGFFVLLALRMVPAYLEYQKVVSTFNAMEKESGYSSAGAIRKDIERRFDVSFVNSISATDVEIKPQGSNYSVTASYEAREHVAGNIYVVMDFEKRILVPKL